MRAPQEGQRSDNARVRALADAPAPAAAPSDSLAKPLAGKIDTIAQKKTEKNQFLTYEHFVTLELANDALPMLYRKLSAVCKADEANACVVLNASLTTDGWSHAQLRIRAKADGINAVANAAVQGARVLSQETRVDDLAGPIADAGRRLEMLNLYKTKLMELDRKAGYDLDTLIRITNTIASVQADIEQITGEKARLTQRTATDILNITLNATPSPQLQITRSYWAPIGHAIDDIIDGIPYAIASLIHILCWVLPVALVVVLAFAIRRKIIRHLPPTTVVGPAEN